MMCPDSKLEGEPDDEIVELLGEDEDEDDHKDDVPSSLDYEALHDDPC
jgi:hypothetical protein